MLLGISKMKYVMKNMRRAMAGSGVSIEAKKHWAGYVILTVAVADFES
jgi:hypothetical protein